ncbi:MAG TPA: SRPBCC domain-containing protein [Novosphingobium sp.]|nr:SRPBCC domain-containing protein [Novosphingobium sp.]
MSGRIRGTCVGHRIEIAAPPELVWDFVADFEGWQGWNPLYVESRGRAEPGGTIRFKVALEGMKAQASAAKVLVVEANERLEYTISGLGGLLKTYRFIEIDELSPTACAVTNGEIMGGPLGGIVSRALAEKVGKGLHGMNEALRRVAERKWQGRAG